jgi:hypothetical protein
MYLLRELGWVEEGTMELEALQNQSLESGNGSNRLLNRKFSFLHTSVSFCLH